MREIKLDLLKCKLNVISPNQYVLLYLLYFKKFEEIEKLFGKTNAIEIRDTIRPKYILSKNGRFTETIISKKNVAALIGVLEESVNFWEWYNLYPMKVGSRILRAATSDSKLAAKHKAKYLSLVKTIDYHEKVKKATELHVQKMRLSNKLQYLQNIETVLNNSQWENWFHYEDEEVAWNTKEI